MNSLIIDGIYKLCAIIYGFIQKSRAYDLFMKVYCSISGMWQKSLIINSLKKRHSGSVSLLYRTMRLPITAAELVNKKAARYLTRNIENSICIKICKGIMNSVIALNTRFLGIFVLVTSLGMAAAGIVRAGGLTKGSAVLLAICIAGILLSIVSINILDYFEESITFGFIKSFRKAMKLEIWYDREFSKNIYSAAGALLLGVACAAAGISEPMLVPVLFTGVMFVFLTISVPFIGVAAAVFLAPFLPTMMLAALCLFTTVAFLIKAISTPGYKWKFGAVGSGIMLMLLFLFFASVFSCSRNSSLMVWAMYFVFMIFFFVLINCTNTKEKLYVLFVCFAVSALGVAVYGILQYIFGWTTDNSWIDETMFSDATMRVYSTLGNPNVLGEYLLLAIPVCAVLMLDIKRDNLAKWFFACTLLVLAGCLILTQSRGCWLGFILGTAIFISFWNGKIWGLALLALCVLPWILPESIISRISSIGNMADSSTSYRVFIWFGVMSMLKDFWIGGIGMGEEAFHMVYPKYSYSAIVAPHSHNVYLQLAVEGGVPTLIVFFGIMFVFLREQCEVYSVTKKGSWENTASLGIIAGTAGFLLQSMFDYTFYNYRVMALFFMFIGMGTALYIMNTGDKIYPGERKDSYDKNYTGIK